MTKQHLGIFAIVAVSLIMGVPSLMAEAEKPVAEKVIDKPINLGQVPNQVVCGVLEPAGTAHWIVYETAFQNGKVKIEETLTGELFDVTDPSTIIGTFSEEWKITEDRSGKDNGNGADKITKKRVSVTCSDGSVEKDKSVEVTHGNK
jgi:hypothetical protein